MGLGALLFPDPPRELPGRRAIKITLRGVHVLSAGVFLATYVFDTAAAPRADWLIATLVSGLGILLLDLHETAAFFLQVRGLIVTGKLVVLACLPWFRGAEAWILGLLVVGSVVSSHAPASFRHRIVLGRGRVRGADSRG
ncbi:MAG: hypothetical protein ACYTEZ_01325 [Planctomycetota bacterium]|jgi:hypothetical protein